MIDVAKVTDAYSTYWATAAEWIRPGTGRQYAEFSWGWIYPGESFIPFERGPSFVERYPCDGSWSSFIGLHNGKIVQIWVRDL